MSDSNEGSLRDEMTNQGSSSIFPDVAVSLRRDLVLHTSTSGGASFSSCIEYTGMLSLD